MLLFLPVPLVLLLFTRAPLGILPSLGIGVALMLTHRLYARPWALARAGARCLWCGADLKATASARLGIPIQDPLGIASWGACGDAHARSARAVLMWAQRQSRWLQLGILGSLAVFLAWALAAGLAQLSPPAFADASAFFRLGVGATVLPLGWLAARTQGARGRRTRALPRASLGPRRPANGAVAVPPDRPAVACAGRAPRGRAAGVADARPR